MATEETPRQKKIILNLKDIAASEDNPNDERMVAIKRIGETIQKGWDKTSQLTAISCLGEIVPTVSRDGFAMSMEPLFQLLNIATQATDREIRTNAILQMELVATKSKDIGRRIIVSTIFRQIAEHPQLSLPERKCTLDRLAQWAIKEQEFNDIPTAAIKELELAVPTLEISSHAIEKLKEIATETPIPELQQAAIDSLAELAIRTFAEPVLRGEAPPDKKDLYYAIREDATLALRDIALDNNALAITRMNAIDQLTYISTQALQPNTQKDAIECLGHIIKAASALPDTRQYAVLAMGNIVPEGVNEEIINKVTKQLTDVTKSKDPVVRENAILLLDENPKSPTEPHPNTAILRNAATRFERQAAQRGPAGPSL